MRRIEAIIKPFKLDDVRKALGDASIEGMTVTEVKGFGRQKGHKEVYRGAEYQVDLVPKLIVEVVVTVAQLDGALTAISGAANTGKIGDGKIFVETIEDAIRLRTGERGDAASFATEATVLLLVLLATTVGAAPGVTDDVVAYTRELIDGAVFATDAARAGYDAAARVLPDDGPLAWVAVLAWIVRWLRQSGRSTDVDE